MKYSLQRFVRNIIYLARCNLKEIYKDSKSYPNSRCNFVAKICDELKNDFDILQPPRVKTPFDTMQELLNTNKSIIRFGDGEYIIMEGGGIPFQKYDRDLGEKLRTIIMSNHNNLMLGIGYEYFHTPIHCRKSVRDFVYTWGVDNYDIIIKYVQRLKEYGSTSISQVYAAYERYDFEQYYMMFKQLILSKKIVIVCGDRVFANIEHNILDGANVQYIYGPAKDAYGELEQLRQEICKRDKDELLLFALGPAGKVLAYEMFLKGYRVLDVGHIFKDYDFYMRGLVVTEDFFAPDV